MELHLAKMAETRYRCGFKYSINTIWSENGQVM